MWRFRISTATWSEHSATSLTRRSVWTQYSSTRPARRRTPRARPAPPASRARPGRPPGPDRSGSPSRLPGGLAAPVRPRIISAVSAARCPSRRKARQARQDAGRAFAGPFAGRQHNTEDFDWFDTLVSKEESTRMARRLEQVPGGRDRRRPGSGRGHGESLSGRGARARVHRGGGGPARAFPRRARRDRGEGRGGRVMPSRTPAARRPGWPSDARDPSAWSFAPSTSAEAEGRGLRS